MLQIPEGLNPDVLALGIQQPWAELILRGQKTIEVRSTVSRVRGLIYIYTSKRPSTLPAARVMEQKHELQLDELPKGLVVGSVELVDVTPAQPADAAAACLTPELLTNQYAWHLRNPQRFAEPHTVRFLPYGVWFYPWKRRPRD